MGNDFVFTESSVGPGDDFVVTRKEQDEVFAVHTIIAGEEADVFWERDEDGDGTFETSIKLDNVDPGISMDAYVPVNEYQGVRLRMENVGSSTADFGVSGRMGGQP